MDVEEIDGKHRDTSEICPTSVRDDLKAPLEMDGDQRFDGEETPKTNNKTDAKEESKPVQNDDKTCRICFSGIDEIDPTDKLISPCKCKGTMKYIHLKCLNEWRRVSQKQTSFYQCDHCKYKYQFGRTMWAKLLVNEFVVALITCCFFALVVFISGFASKALLILLGDGPDIYDFDSVPENEQDLLFVIEKSLSPASFWNIDIPHMLSGLVGVGLIGCTTLIFSVFTGGPFFPRFGVFGRGNDRGGSTSGIVLTIIVLVGAARTFYSIYRLVSRKARDSLQMVENIILEVD